MFSEVGIGRHCVCVQKSIKCCIPEEYILFVVGVIPLPRYR